MLSNIKFPKTEEYRTGTENEPFSFYLEALFESNHLDLLLGYFSSSAINVLALGFASFIHNGGKIRPIINHILSSKDKRAVIAGNTTEAADYPFSEEDYLSLKSALNDYGKHFFECLAWLISSKRIQIRAIKPKNRGGISHYKSGIFYDGSNKVKFKGSCNFTASGLLENLEELDVKLSWKEDAEVFDEYEKEFNLLFEGKRDYAQLIDFKQIEEAILRDYGNKDLDELLLDEQSLLEKKATHKLSKSSQDVIKKIMQKIEAIRNAPRFPYEEGPRDYQKEAYKNWVENGFHGIFAMATGTGKTLTSLNCALNEFNKNNRYKVVILVPTTILVEQWEKEARKFYFRNTIKASSKNPAWKKAISEIEAKSLFGEETSFILISTYKTFTSNLIQTFIKKLPEDAILIADEAHNIGSPSVLKKLKDIKLNKLIGLSATPKRAYDPEGSSKMEEFFKDAEPYTYSFPMERAIDEGILCPYYYYPKVVELTPCEMVEYSDISTKLAKLHDRAEKDSVAKKQYEMLLMERKRIIHKAQRKLESFEAVINEIQHSSTGLHYTLVYAPEGFYSDEENLEESFPEIEADSRIIDFYSNIVRRVAPNTTVTQYTSESSDKEHVLNSFEDGRIDVLLSMKCLDEGVDIPRTEQAIFCSSTGNPRQFIQRRGRILRKHRDKSFAKIYDLVVVPQTLPSSPNFELERNMVRKELERVVHFGYMAMNKYEALEAVKAVCDFYQINLDSIHLELAS